MKYEAQPGQHIKNACIESKNLAIKHNKKVEFDFNGVTLYCNPDSDLKFIEECFTVALRENREEYLQSDEYNAFQQKQKEELERHQENIDYLMISFIHTLEHGNLDSIMNWLKHFAIHDDFIGVTYDNKQYIADFLEINGFKENEHVGKSKNFFNDKENMARYIIGQVINFLRKGMPPHQITLKFIDDYFTLGS